MPAAGTIRQKATPGGPVPMHGRDGKSAPAGLVTFHSNVTFSLSRKSPSAPAVSRTGVNSGRGPSTSGVASRM
jgi:hypothetical protein